MRIAIIDSGIASGFCEDIIKCKCDVINEKYSNCAEDEIGHGTACADIICKYCSDAELFIYKIYNKELKTEVKYLVKALERSIEADVDIINLSLGVIDTEHINLIEEKCREANIRNIRIIAAGSENSNLSCWPADFPFVIKVEGNTKCRKDQLLLTDKDNITVEAYNGKEFARWIGGRSNIVWGNSFACARTTGLLAKALFRKKRVAYGELINFLEQVTFAYKAKEWKQLIKTNNIDCLSGKKVGLFPFNKEMHSLIRFRNFFDFEIKAVTDLPFSKYVQKDSGCCIGLEANNIMVEADFRKMLQADIDTIILGDLSEIFAIWKKDYLVYYSEKAFSAGKDVVSIELLSNEKYDYVKSLSAKYKRTFMALNDQIISMGDDAVPDILLKTPVLCVLGTGPKVGKFTAQVELFKYLSEAGYNVELISTEPQGFLFNFDTIPLGNYNLVNMIPLDRQINYIKFICLKKIQEKSPDILLTGGQSGVVPFNYAIPTDYNSLSSFLTILATKPDGFILCVNPNDDMEYIKRTITAIESFGYGKVFMCIMSSQAVHVHNKNGIIFEERKQLERNDCDKKCRALSEEIKVPVYNFSDRFQIKNIIYELQNYFSDQ